MDKVIADCKSIWTEEYQQEVIRILQNGKNGKTLKNSEYHLLRKYKLVRFGGVDKVANVKGGGYMATKQVALVVI